MMRGEMLMRKLAFTGALVFYLQKVGPHLSFYDASKSSSERGGAREMQNKLSLIGPDLTQFSLLLAEIFEWNANRYSRYFFYKRSELSLILQPSKENCEIIPRGTTSFSCLLWQINYCCCFYCPSAGHGAKMRDYIFFSLRTFCYELYLDSWNSHRR